MAEPEKAKLVSSKLYPPPTEGVTFVGDDRYLNRGSPMKSGKHYGARLSKAQRLKLVHVIEQLRDDFGYDFDLMSDYTTTENGKSLRSIYTRAANQNRGGSSVLLDDLTALLKIEKEERAKHAEAARKGAEEGVSLLTVSAGTLDGVKDTGVGTIYGAVSLPSSPANPSWHERHEAALKLVRDAIAAYEEAVLRVPVVYRSESMVVMMDELNMVITTFDNETEEDEDEEMEGLARTLEEFNAEF